MTQTPDPPGIPQPHMDMPNTLLYIRKLIRYATHEFRKHHKKKHHNSKEWAQHAHLIQHTLNTLVNPCPTPSQPNTNPNPSNPGNPTPNQPGCGEGGDPLQAALKPIWLCRTYSFLTASLRRLANLLIPIHTHLTKTAQFLPHLDIDSLLTHLHRRLQDHYNPYIKTISHSQTQSPQTQPPNYHHYPTNTSTAQSSTRSSCCNMRIHQEAPYSNNT